MERKHEVKLIGFGDPAIEDNNGAFGVSAAEYHERYRPRSLHVEGSLPTVDFDEITFPRLAENGDKVVVTLLTLDLRKRGVLEHYLKNRL
jgi:hypothetical protein